ncbi:hypothetical protein ACFPOI_47745 [Nonomuraea angiospora]|uniref:Uncharacterized protein n=1 Tax=Nonomuraea angiospora TaxID=46172 RepID=A0ABR9LXW6_9ACTN|nr:hypothetical protein [Nonomuraea angiospora]MBE1585474.1 hypothetical protein [Nonomuraea angiospora]
MSSYVRTIREYMRQQPPPTWTELPLAGEQLSEIILFGHGKDADVMVELLDGRQFVLGLGGTLRVHGCPGLETEVTRWDDRSLVIRYFGQNLKVAAVRLGVPDRADVEELVADAHEWLATDGVEDLLWGVSIEIEVVPILQDAD